MRGYMFKNSKGALFFVALTLLGVATLVGTEDNEGALLKAAANIEQQRNMMNEDRRVVRGNSAPIGFASSNGQTREFTADEDLIDDATGFDPTPEYEAPLVSAEPQVNLVESSAEIISE